MSAERVVEVTGGDWLSISPATLESVEATFETATYSATETNPAVRAESLRTAYPILSTNPLISQKRLLEELLRAQELPLTLMLTEEELAQQRAAMAPPAAGPMGVPADMMPGAPEMPGAAVNEAPLPNRVAGMAEAPNPNAAAGPAAAPPMTEEQA